MAVRLQLTELVTLGPNVRAAIEASASRPLRRLGFCGGIALGRYNTALPRQVRLLEQQLTKNPFEERELTASVKTQVAGSLPSGVLKMSTLATVAATRRHRRESGRAVSSYSDKPESNV